MKQSPAHANAPDRRPDLEEAMEIFNRALSPFQPAVNGVTETFRRIAPAVLSFIQEVERLPMVIQTALVRLADEGWYLDPNGMTLQDPADIAEAYLQGRRDEAEQLLMAHYRSRLSTIEAELTEHLPSRAAIVRQALEAHRQGLYFVSVPALLAQVDGVCLDLGGQHFFMRRDKPALERTALELLEQKDGLAKAMLAPFFTKTSIRLSSGERPKDFHQLNRHMVLHGEALDYGTEMRSLQALALLYYVDSTLAHFANRIKANV